MSDVDEMLSWLRGVLDAVEGDRWHTDECGLVQYGSGTSWCTCDSEARTRGIVAAHRKILDAYADALANDGYVQMGGWASCSDECAVAVLGEVVKVVVSAYANRDGYRPEWGQR